MKKGWIPLPVLYKIIFILLLLGVFLSFNRINSILEEGYFILGYTISGYHGLIIFYLVDVLPVAAVLFFMINRYRWTWKFAIICFGFYLLNSSFSLINIEERLEKLMFLNIEKPELTHDLLFSSLLSRIIISNILNVIVIVIFLVKRKYFVSLETESEKTNS